MLVGRAQNVRRLIGKQGVKKLSGLMCSGDYVQLSMLLYMVTDVGEPT